MLAEDAIKAAVKDYEAKKAKLSRNSNTAPVEKAVEAWAIHLFVQQIVLAKAFCAFETSYYVC